MLKQENKIGSSIAISAFLVATILLIFSLPAPADHKKQQIRRTKSQAESVSNSRFEGKKLFALYCAHCHIGGDNLARPGRPIVGSDKLLSLAIFKAYLEAPPGHMPSYEDVIKNPQILQSLYKYCRTLDSIKSRISLQKISD